MKVNDKLGSGTITFVASNGGKETKLRSTISVRPPTTFMTQVRSSNFTKNSADVPMTREMYPEFRKLTAAVSALPLGLAHGLDAYLKDFPHGCSEQITSAAFCRLVLADEADFGLSKPEVNAQLENVFAVLRRRQNDQGAFGYWAPEKGAGDQFHVGVCDAFPHRSESGRVRAAGGNVRERSAQFAGHGGEGTGGPR